MESGTHVKSVKITLNIFLVCPSWCGTQARSSEGGLSFHSTESNQEGLLKLKARICIVDWLAPSAAQKAREIEIGSSIETRVDDLSVSEMAKM